MSEPTQENIINALRVLSAADKDQIVEALFDWSDTATAQDLVLTLREVAEDAGSSLGDQHGGDAWETVKEARRDDDPDRKHDLYLSALSLVAEAAYIYRETQRGEAKRIPYDRLEGCVDAAVAHALEKSDAKRLCEETYDLALENLDERLDNF